ncbi:cellulase family glycosylhydrolase [Pseudoduganella sp. DS3]|uniref:Cellulase family glycosylhydrolase n=1 Tax=Pseudoduganella guangdongensis TaxID=2692179 RepID=A0A6N9HFG1_9BURK|nr:cellulase family glycosylhydrolase [Pseudoduganella guangdongensis]MYN01793.1 cellulase family glycosylhydrolase [Pseudoduganella guangdongensis]
MSHFLSRLALLFIAGLTIGTTAIAANNARFLTQSVPHTMEVGRPYQVSVTVKNTGSTNWTADRFKLGFRAQTDSIVWGTNRILLAPGEVVAPGQLKQFSFTVTAPPAGEQYGRAKSYEFGWQLVEEGAEWFGDATPLVSVDVFRAPGVDVATGATDAAFRLFPPVKAPPPAPPGLFDHSFRGANVLEQTYEDERKCDHTAWIPNAEQIDVIARNAVDMGLSYLRMPVIVPPVVPGNSLGPQYCDSVHLEWYGPDNATNMAAVTDKLRTVLDTAQRHGLKMVVVIDGYTKYDEQCYWKRSFKDIEANARTLVQTFSPHPAVLAWDILNEPLWNAGYFGCLNSDADYASVVNAVHAMYNLVRANDPYDHPTTVGEAQTPNFKYWRDISSYASPHLYITPHQARVAKDPGTNFVNVDQVVYVQGAALREIERIFGQLPVVIGEFGEATGGGRPDDTFDDAAKERYINKFLDGLSIANHGHMLWSLSMSSLPSQQGHSFLEPDGALKPAAEALARRTWYPVVQQLYLGYLGRSADPVALQQAASQLLAVARASSYTDHDGREIRMAPTLQGLDQHYDSNAQLRELIDSLGASAESQGFHNYKDTGALVRGIFAGAFKRLPEGEGAQYWINEINSGRTSKGRAVLSILAGATANTTPQGLVDAATMRAKGQVSANFTASLNTDAWVQCYSNLWAANANRRLLDTVDSSTNVKAYQAKIDALLREMASGLPHTQQKESRPVCH